MIRLPWSAVLAISQPAQACFVGDGGIDGGDGYADLPQCLVKFSAVIERQNQFRVHDVADENDSTIIGVSKSFL